jgi:biotin carboxylase
MILGAGPFQLPAIRKAVDLGYYVITVDYLPDNVGHKVSHCYVNCSTRDREGVARAARDLGVDGVFTFSSDAAIPTVGYVCEQLGLPGIGLATAETMAQKHLFRAFLKEHGLPCPGFVVAEQFEALQRIAERLRFPVIFKPVDTSGSRGITKVNSPDESKIATAFKYARTFSHTGTVCIEEFNEGTEVGGDGILHNGRFAFIAITHKRLNGFIVTGHSIPTNISKEDQARVIHALEECCSALGYMDGPLNFDVMVSVDQTIILEMSGRNGGNGIPPVIARATGIDVEVATLRLAMGEQLNLPVDGPAAAGAASWIFGSESGGVLREIRDMATVRADVPEMFDLILAAQPGSTVKPFEHNGNLIGCALFDCESSAHYDSIIRRIRHSLQIKIDQIGARD